MFEEGAPGVLEKNIEKAAEYYKIAADQNLPAAMQSLGWIYEQQLLLKEEDGEDRRKEYEHMGIELQHAAALMGNSRAVLFVKTNYERGNTYFPVDSAKAAQMRNLYIHTQV